MSACLSVRTSPITALERSYRQPHPAYLTAHASYATMTCDAHSIFEASDQKCSNVVHNEISFFPRVASNGYRKWTPMKNGKPCPESGDLAESSPSCLTRRTETQSTAALSVQISRELNRYHGDEKMNVVISVCSSLLKGPSCFYPYRRIAAERGHLVSNSR